MALALSSLRSAVAQQVAALSGFSESKFPFEYFQRQENTKAHKSFSIGIQGVEETTERQRRAIYYVRTQVNVAFAYRMRPLDVYPVDYDLALDTEEDVIAAVLSSYASIQNEVTIRFIRSTRELLESMEYQIHTLEFQALHTLNP